MKTIKYLIITSLLFVSSLVSYEKIGVSENKVIDDTIIKEDVIEEEPIEEVVEEIKEETPIETISIDSKESTKKEEKKTTTTTKKDSKNKTKTSKKNKEESKSEKNDKSKEDEPKEDKPKQEETKPDKPKEDPKPQCSDFYESITHGKVDKSTKFACVSYGNKIQNNELDAVLDYNEEHGNVKKPTISYFRCYEVVDKNCNTNGWYLHFFCSSGECNDSKLKSLYG